jgi:hypothetical protein
MGDDTRDAQHYRDKHGIDNAELHEKFHWRGSSSRGAIFRFRRDRSQLVGAI